MPLTQMYPAKNNSPTTVLAAPLNSSDNVMTLEDTSVLPEPPNIAVIGSSDNAEIVLYSAIDGSNVSILRGQHGTSIGIWPEGAPVSRNFTSLDHDIFIENIEALDQNKADSADLGELAYKGTLAVEDIPDLNASKITAGTLPVARGGTGKTTHTQNAVLTGNGGSELNDVSTANGALYATGTNAAPQFGILPAAQGGTGAATAAANSVFAGPASGSSAAAPSFRALAAADIPNLNASKITAGTLAVARGGTGAATAAANHVFAGPASGSAAAPSFRALAAADIPNLNASKITAGTLPVARGGTGAATAAVNRVFAGPASGSSAAAPSFRALAAADIPNLNASKITAGTLSLDRGGTGGTDSNWIDYESSVCAAGNNVIYIRKIGQWVQILGPALKLKTALTSDSGLTILSLASTYKPIGKYFMWMAASTYDLVYYWINGSSLAVFKNRQSSSLPTNYTFYISCMYFVGGTTPT